VKKIILVLAILVLLMVLVPAGTAQEKKPLRGETTYLFMAADPDNLIIDPDKGVLFWEGPITGDFQGTIRWWGWEIEPTGQASHYDMSWDIEDEAENLLLAGVESGTTTARHGKNSVWRANGVVTFAAGDYAHLLGRRVHDGGHFTWAAPGLPLGGEGIFRVN
jgi:hypothetical protein